MSRTLLWVADVLLNLARLAYLAAILALGRGPTIEAETKKQVVPPFPGFFSKP